MPARSPLTRFSPPRSVRASALPWIAVLAWGAAQPATGAPPVPEREPLSALQLRLPSERWTGDFPGMVKRREIRIAVPFSHTLYFVDRGSEFGISAALIRDFERWLNRRHAREFGKRPLIALVVVTTPDEMLPKLASGHADIAVGNLTVTPERLAVADFVAPADAPRNVEVLVTGPASPPIASLDDLAGKTVHVRVSSSYHESLVALNERFRAAGKPAVRLVAVPDILDDEDLMQMVGAGMLPAIVVDDWKARIWAPVVPGMRVRDDVVLRKAGRLGWAIRKGSPQIAAEIAAFYADWVRPTGFLYYEHRAYVDKFQALDDASGAEDRRRLDALFATFDRYGLEYGFDPLLLAAQGYQESRLDQSKRSAAGAIGVMQLMPATGAALDVGDIRLAEPNIHAAAKYLTQILDVYFADARFDAINRALFAFAAYNAGPTAIGRARDEAARRGLDPNLWFGHVEPIVADRIGIETTGYVRNICKYYYAYRLAAEERAAAARSGAPAPP